MHWSTAPRFVLAYGISMLSFTLWSPEASADVLNSSFTTEDKCQSMLGTFNKSRDSGGECNLMFDKGDPYVICMIYVRIEAPLDGNEPEDMENKLDFAVSMDYRVDLILDQSTKSVDVISGNELRCILAKSVSFKRVDGKDGHRRANVTLASSIFSVIFNAENINEGVDLVEPVVAGVAVIPKKCPLRPKQNHPRCPVKFRVSSLLKLPGTPGDIFTGVDDLILTAFGYSHLKELQNASKIIKELNLSTSKLTKMTPLISKQLDGFKHSNLGGNNLVHSHDAGAENISRFTRNMSHIKKLNIYGSVTENFSSMTVPKLPELMELDAFKCEIMTMEEDSFRHLPALVRIDLSSNKLNSLPKRIFADLKYLQYVDLSNNKFTEGQGLAFHYHEEWPKEGMQALYFSSNPLISAANLIADGSQIRFIDLRNCIMRDIKGVSFRYVEKVDLSSNYIPAISNEGSKILSHVQYLNLTDNQFNCDSCDLRDFQHWLNTTGRKILTEDVRSLLCAAPPALRKDGIKVFNARYNEDLCRGPDFPFVLGLTASIIALVAALLVGVLNIASYVLHLIRVRKSVVAEGTTLGEFKYDAFVLYSGRDRSWVLRVLQPELEESDQKYQLCLHDRNFALGGLITQNVVDSIDKSRKTILILSENFVDSHWCQWEMKMANHILSHGRCESLVMIELERLDRKNIPRLLRFLMETRTYLEWPTESLAALTSNDIETLDYSKIEIEGSGESTEPELQVFWKRLRETLGDSLYVREQKARKEAELALRLTRLKERLTPGFCSK